jgi:arabinofuranosyltransferase
VAALLGFAIVLLRTAWLCDDAYISFRTIRNFVSGDGLRWNTIERVQSYTHPLWLFVLSAARMVTGELYYTTMLLSVGLSVAAVALMAWGLAPSPIAGVALVIVVASSRGFVDFSTSGLENPLTHLLLAAMLLVYARSTRLTPRGLLLLSAFAGLCAVNRLDTLLLTSPILLYALLRDGTRRGALAVVAGLSPLLAWELFSLVYYGFPVPNTAYAKLPAGIAWSSRLEKGLGFLQSCAGRDPVAALLIPLGILAPFARRRWALVPLSIGSLLYVLYGVGIGGDFMAGRFLTAPLMLALMAGVTGLSSTSGLWWVASAGVLSLSLSLGPFSPWLAGADYGSAWDWRENIDSRGIADERALYYPITGLMRAGQAFDVPWSPWFEKGSQVEPGGVRATRTAGFLGYAAPRDAYIIDVMGLGDALLARLPPRNLRDWRPGHLERALPKGYRETRRRGVNVLEDVWLATYFRELTVVTQGSVWSWRRARAIWALNTGGADELLRRYAVERELTTIGK